MAFPRSAAFRRAAALLAASLLSLAIYALSLAAGGSAAPSPAPGAALIALVSRSGDITIRRADDNRQIAAIRPGLFETTWQFRGAGTSGGSGFGGEAGGGTTRTTGTIRATTAGAVVAVAGEVTASGNRLRLRYAMTPDKPLTVNSAHVSVNVPVASYLGAPWKREMAGAPGAAAGAVPATAKDTHLVGGPSRSLTLGAAPSPVLVVRSENDGVLLPLLLQDNRVFGGSELEIRVGEQSGDGRTLATGKPEVIAFTVDLPGPVTVQREEPIVLRAGNDWVPLDLKLDIAPGSALDFSFLALDGDGAANRRQPGGGAPVPAGTYGRVIVRPDGHFGFERGLDRPVRFYGVNLCFGANYLDKATADRLADRFQRIGYNTVRIHHYESELIDTNAPSGSLTFRPDSLDKLDYLVAALKKRGIYVKTDLFVSRPVKSTELDTEPAGMDQFKAALLVSEKALDNWKAFSRTLLTHVNPYTGVAYKDEPALAWISVVNEPNATNYLGSLSGSLRARFEAEWHAYLRERYGSDAALAAAWNEPGATRTAPLPRSVNDTERPARSRDVGAFLARLHERAFAKMRDFLRKEIGTKALLTDLNGWSETPAFMAARTQLDWVDNHFYWDHPQFLEGDWRLPSRGGSGGQGAVETAGAGPNFVAMTRLFGKPFSVSEYNYSSPNPYRAEGGLIMGAAAALQDWDAVWRFAYSHSRHAVASPQPLNYFDMAVDPAGQASERAALLLFLRGDLKAAPGAAVAVRSRQELLELTGKGGDNFGDLVLVTRIGTQVRGMLPPSSSAATPSDQPLDAGFDSSMMTLFSSGQMLAALRRDKILTTNRTDLQNGVRESETGELFVDGPRGLLRINTPRTVGGVAPVGRIIEAGPLSAKVTGTRATLWVSSLDGQQPVRQARRLLLVHLTDVQMTNMRYAAPDRRVLEDWGTLPHLARQGGAQVTLEHAQAGTLKAWRLDTAGNRLAPVRVRASGNKAVLDLSTRGADGKATLYYELATE